jgi:hypothetical protein
MNSRKGDSSHHVYLLDTMNNVLGILILVLILTQVLDVSSGGKRPPRKGEVEQLQKRLNESLAALNLKPQDLSEASVREREADAALSRGDLNKKLASLAAAAKDSNAAKAELESVSQRTAAAEVTLKNARSKADIEEELARQKRALASAAADRQAALTKLKSLEDRVHGDGGQAIGLGKGSPPTELWKPGQTALFICRKGKIAYWDTTECGKEIRSLGERYRADCQSKGADTSFDGFVTFASHQAFETDLLTIKCRALENDGGVVFTFEPKLAPGWEDATALSNPHSAFLRKLTQFDADKTAVNFLVWGDSFDTYARAVLQAKKLTYRTGWVPFAPSEELKQAIGPGISNDSGPNARTDPR